MIPENNHMTRLCVSRLNRLFRWITAPLRNRVVILLYHRVYDASVDPWELCVSPGHFAEHLEVLSKNYQVMSLSELVKKLKEAKLPKRGVVLTFDDGYADNFLNAKPLLEKYRLPATIFVTSDCLDSPTEFWWDDLERVLLQPKNLPNRLELRIQERLYVWPLTNIKERKVAYIAIHNLLQPLRDSERNPVIREIFTWADVEPIGRSTYRSLTSDELIQLAQSEFVTIGAHTASHPFLSVMTEVEQYNEIAGSRIKLEETIGYCVDTFSYPYGSLTNETVKIVDTAEFKVALTIDANAIEVGANPLKLGRFGVGDWTGKLFRQRLDAFFRT
jgi:peptidoglycan/xylan/chitin deacetylase (PgdA/CDA1 family)